jgi:hypothetical protein
MMSSIQYSRMNADRGGRRVQTVRQVAEPPMPGRSSAITVNRLASSGAIGFHISEVSA